MIQETDLAYSKIVESSQMLLTVLKRESEPPGPGCHWHSVVCPKHCRFACQ